MRGNLSLASRLGSGDSILNKEHIEMLFCAIINKRRSFYMEVSVRIPDKIKAHLKEPYDKYVNETLVVEMYREGLFTLRQAAEILGVEPAEMHNVLSRRKSYINYGSEELNEDISYARSK